MAGVSREEGPVVRMERPRAVPAEFELPVGCCEVGEAWRSVRVEAAGGEVHGEASHFARAAEERTSAHGRELLKPSFLGSLVLEPDLERKSV